MNWLTIELAEKNIKMLQKSGWSVDEHNAMKIARQMLDEKYDSSSDAVAYFKATIWNMGLVS